MDLGSLLTLIPSLIAQFGGVKETPAEASQRGLADELTSMARASTNPNDPRYLALYNAEKNSGQQDLARVIAEAQGQNRMATRMGRTPLFDSGRGGETLFRSLMQSYGGVQDKARATARGTLTQGVQNLGTGYDAYRGLAQQQDLRQRRNLAMELGGYDAIGGYLNAGSKGGESAYGVGPGGQQINWSTPRAYGSGGESGSLFDALQSRYRQPGYMNGLM